MDIETRQENGFLIISPQGDIDMGASTVFDQFLLQRAEAGNQRVILDFGKVGYIDSSGIGSIVRVHRHLKDRGGAVILAGCSANLQKIFRLINFQKYFRIVSTVPEAMTEP